MAGVGRTPSALFSTGVFIWILLPGSPVPQRWLRNPQCCMVWCLLDKASLKLLLTRSLIQKPFGIEMALLGGDEHTLGLRILVTVPYSPAAPQVPLEVHKFTVPPPTPLPCFICSVLQWPCWYQSRWQRQKSFLGDSAALWVRGGGSGYENPLFLLVNVGL